MATYSWTTDWTTMGKGLYVTTSVALSRLGMCLFL